MANTTPISIHDSDSENEAILTTKKNKSSKIVKHNDGTVISKVKKNSMLSRDKFENIKHWVDSVNFQIELKDSSAYSELSTIYGGESGTNFITERTGRAVNSTFIGSASIHFEELFKQKTDILSQPKEELKVVTNEPDEIDESYVEKDTRSDKIMENVKNTIYRLDDVDLISNSDKSVISSSSKRKSEEKSNLNKDCISKSDEDIINESDNSFSLDGSLKTRLKNKTNISSERKISRKILNNNKYPENNRDNSGKVDKGMLYCLN